MGGATISRYNKLECSPGHRRRHSAIAAKSLNSLWLQAQYENPKLTKNGSGQITLTAWGSPE